MYILWVVSRSPRQPEVFRRALVLPVLLAGLAGGCEEDSGKESEGQKGGPAASSEKARAPKTARFKPGIVRVGQRRSVRRSSHTNMSVEFWADGEHLGTNEPSRDETSSREETVLAVVGRNPSRVRVHYSTYSLREQKPNEPVAEDALLQGHTYVVDGAASPMRITTPDDELVSPEIRQRLLPQHAHLAEQDPLVERLQRGEWEVGKSYALHEKLFRALLGADKGKYERGQVRIVAIRKLDGLPVADFEWSGKMSTQEEGNMEVQWDVDGTAIVSLVPAQVLKTELTAQLEVSGKRREQGRWVTMTGAGKVTDKVERTAWQ